ncbi:MAG: lysophospholipid transporter LplT, partial [Methylococcales bacterium]|nr:lysophospholipid transporter LplT [Methylococcales bacterium]
IVLAPWVGPFADRHPKPRVLIIANIIKAVGAAMILLHLEPLIAYAIVGAGAAIYSPAKYGILPELANHQQLLKANSWIESSTIFAIVLGTVIGAKVADTSVTYALLLIIAAYLVSAATTFGIPRMTARAQAHEPALQQFTTNIKEFLNTSRASFVLLGSSLFWATAATLRVILIAWAPLVLHMQQASDIAELTLFLSIGIIAGATAVPRLIPLEHLNRCRYAAFGMAVFIVALAITDTLWPARSVMLAIGISGGLLIVPLIAALQELGHQSIGAGDAVAIQNFFSNVAMLVAVAIYALSASQGANPITCLYVLGILVWIANFCVSRHLPKQT